MSKRQELLKVGGKHSYILSSSPETKSISEDMNDLEVREFQIETAKFVERLCVDLVVMSTRADMSFLAYLLDMARIEASDRIETPELSEASNMA